MNHFHFTLGPVQSFVAQSRRTRDLWAGSFLLSWLSGQAMRSVLDQGGTIIFPDVGTKEAPQDPMLQAILKQPGAPTPSIGSLPNRFKAQVPEGFDPENVGQAVAGKWRELEQAVYSHFLTQSAALETTWNRQVSHFWEINWVLGAESENDTDNYWLDQRKNWRNHWPQDEGGDHCTLMGNYQELSGRVRSKSREERTAQDEFWKSLRKKTPGDRLDIRDNERLCAIALIKRLFPRLGAEALMATIGWIPGGQQERIAYWPSTTYMAAVPWLEKIANDKKSRIELETYVETIKQQLDGNTFRKLVSERHVKISCLASLSKISIGVGAYLDDLDGDLLNPHSLANPRVTYLSDEQPKNMQDDPDKEKRKALIGSLNRVNKAVGSPTRSYYALLLMDGDHLGKMLRDKNPVNISQALLAFTSQVPTTVASFGGVTIYAGGDDVLALLPLDNAIACAQALRSEYADFFSERKIDKATASCAIVLAHHQSPLQGVLSEAHHQLDDIAKERNGRDALALAILKPSGVTAQWVNPWSSVPSLQMLVQSMKEGSYPRGFFHKLRDRYGFFEQPDDAPEGIDLKQLLVAEFLQTRERDISRQEAEQCVEQLLSACKPFIRDERGEEILKIGLRLGGGFIARFLTQEKDG